MNKELEIKRLRRVIMLNELNTINNFIAVAKQSLQKARDEAITLFGDTIWWMTKDETKYTEEIWDKLGEALDLLGSIEEILEESKKRIGIGEVLSDDNSEEDSKDS